MESDSKSTALSPELQAHVLLWPNYSRFKEQNLQILALFVTQPTSFSHLQLQEVRDRRLSRGRGIFRCARWIW